MLSHFLITMIATGATRALGSERAAENQQPPHLLVILVDDLGYNNVGFHNDQQISPEIDRLAQEEGVVLEALYTFRYCSPSRSALMSGRFPIHVNQGNPRCVGTKGGVDLRMEMLPAKLKRAGYKTAIVGKWHLGARSNKNIPVRRGFDYHFGFLGGGEHHFTQKSSACENYVDLWEGVPERAGPAYGQNGTYSCNLYSRKAVDFIHEHDPSTPLFMYVAFHDVHAPYECPSAYEDPRLRGTPRQTIQGMVTCVSQATGNITDALKAKGMFNNSLIVWAADNGGPQFEAANNYPLRGGKMTDYQGGVRVAAFATGGLIPLNMRGRVVNGAMHLCDIHVTFCKLAGIQDCSDDVVGLPGVDGIDVSSLFFTPEHDPSRVVGNASSPRQEIVLSSAAIIVGEWKFMLPDFHINDLSSGACRVSLSSPSMAPISSHSSHHHQTPHSSHHHHTPHSIVKPTLITTMSRGNMVNVSSSLSNKGQCSPTTVHNDTGCTTDGHYNSTPTTTWQDCCAACAEAPSDCGAWTFHANEVGDISSNEIGEIYRLDSSSSSSGLCILARRPRLLKGVANATCGCRDGSCPAPPAPKQPSCGYWTGPVWPTVHGHKDPGYVPDPGCPPSGCLFHLPSDPSERHDLSRIYPGKLAELAQRLSVLRSGAYQTLNYTAGCDECVNVTEIAALHRGFVAPPCNCSI